MWPQPEPSLWRSPGNGHPLSVHSIVLHGNFRSQAICWEGLSPRVVLWWQWHCCHHCSPAPGNTSVPTCLKHSLGGSLSTNPAPGWDMFMPSENTSWGIFKCTVRHKSLCQQTVQDKDEIFTFCFCSNPFFVPFLGNVKILFLYAINILKSSPFVAKLLWQCTKQNLVQYQSDSWYDRI